MAHMLLKFKLTIIAGLLAISNIATAKNYNIQQNGNWGVDLQYNFAKPKNDWEKVFRHKQAGFGAHLGYDFNCWVGLEAGLWWTLRRTVDNTIGNGVSAFGVTNNANSTISSRIRHRSIYLDLNFYSVTYEQTNLLAKIGASYFWQHPSVRTFPAGRVGGIIDVVKGNNKLVPKFGLGAERMFSGGVWGLRALWQYDMISKNKFSNISPPYNKAFKNASTFSIGVFRKFDFIAKLM
jgi:hypothetical protein